MADTKAEMFSYVEIAMETNMDNNEYTLEECDVDDNEEGMIRDMRLLLLRISTWTVVFISRLKEEVSRKIILK